MITVYSKPHCPDCERTKTKMRRAGIVFNDVDITQDEEALTLVRDVYGFRQAPVVKTPDDVWSGFQPDKIDGLAR